jgi:hypothetical protein
MLYRRVAFLTLLFTLALFALQGGQTLAAKHGGGGHTTASGTFGLVLLDSTDGSAHWGQRVTFNVSTTATTEPHVSLKCSQNGVLVYAAQTGYYAGYLWPWTQVMTLSSVAWTGGSADCVATLYYFSGATVVSLGTSSFTAYP